MGDIGIPRYLFVVHYRVSWPSRQDGGSDIYRHLSHPARDKAVFPPFHAHRGVPDMVLLCTIHS